MAQIFITGDTHGSFARVAEFTRRFNTSPTDILIILGDAGINFHGGSRDLFLKRQLAELPITLFCVHGNHEMRPFTLPTYITTQFNGAPAYVEPCFPNLIFAKDGEVYDFNGYRSVVIGGAYSIDKAMRTPGVSWWADEQPSLEIKRYVEDQLALNNRDVDVVLSHTCPFVYEPPEITSLGTGWTNIDKSTEKWLDKIENRLAYKRWYCGHWHIDKFIDETRFMFESIVEFYPYS